MKSSHLKWPDFQDRLHVALQLQVPTPMDNRCDRLRETLRSGAMLKDKSFLQKFVMPPSAATRMLWDMLGILCVCYDVFMIPFLGAFDVTLNTGMIAVSIAVAIFWSIDLMAMFLTGFHTSGLIEMRPSRIAKNYLQTWLMLDLVIVATDWFFIAMQLQQRYTPAGGAKSLRMFRSIRMVRSVKLLSVLRFSKASMAMDLLRQSLRSPAMQTFVQVVEALIVILTVNHIICCMWYYIGTYDQDPITWVRVAGIEGRSTFYLYLTSLHWAMTQFTPAGMNIQATNARERIFVLIVDLLGLCAFSTFVSSITTRMTQLRSIRKDQIQRERELRTFFNDNQLSLELMSRIEQYTRTKAQAKHDVRVLQADLLLCRIFQQR